MTNKIIFRFTDGTAITHPDIRESVKDVAKYIENAIKNSVPVQLDTLNGCVIFNMNHVKAVEIEKNSNAL